MPQTTNGARWNIKRAGKVPAVVGWNERAGFGSPFLFARRPGPELGLGVTSRKAQGPCSPRRAQVLAMFVCVFMPVHANYVFGYYYYYYYYCAHSLDQQREQAVLAPLCRGHGGPGWHQTGEDTAHQGLVGASGERSLASK